MCVISVLMHRILYGVGYNLSDCEDRTSKQLIILTWMDNYHNNHASL